MMMQQSFLVQVLHSGYKNEFSVKKISCVWNFLIGVNIAFLPPNNYEFLRDVDIFVLLAKFVFFSIVYADLLTCWVIHYFLYTEWLEQYRRTTEKE